MLRPGVRTNKTKNDNRKAQSKGKDQAVVVEKTSHVKQTTGHIKQNGKFSILKFKTNLVISF